MADKQKKGMGTFGKLIIGLVLIIVLVAVAGFAYGLSLPSSKTFTRSVVIKADESDIHKYVGDLKQWPEWGPWREMDPDMTWEFSETTDEVGSWTTWKGKDGNGRLEIISTDENKGIEYTLTFEGWDPQKGAIRYAEEGDDIKVTWQAHMDVGGNVVYRYMISFFEGSMNEMFDKGLANVKAKAEAE
jgi:hypothetical protein